MRWKHILKIKKGKKTAETDLLLDDVDVEKLKNMFQVLYDFGILAMDVEVTIEMDGK